MIFPAPDLEEDAQGIDFDLPVLFASDCPPCPGCGEPYCLECGAHYADCRHPGPDSEPERKEPDL